MTTAPARCPMQHDTSSSSKDISQCPIMNPSNNIPASLSQQPVDGQAMPLPTDRQESSIPTGDGGARWVYPSEQQFYNALHRKGKETKEEDISMIVAIHNELNERCWQEIQRWETMSSSASSSACTPRLVKFVGQPNKLSPKAWLYSSLGWAPRPFDRHDWIVERCGEQVRYVIDYYDGGEERGDGRAAVIHCDVRPALDSMTGVRDRARALWRSMTGSDDDDYSNM